MPMEMQLRYRLTCPAELLQATGNAMDILGCPADDLLDGKVALRERIHADDADIAERLFTPAETLADEIANLRLQQTGGGILCVKAVFRKRHGDDPGGMILDLTLQDAKSLKRTMGDASSMVNFRAMMENTNDFIYFKDRNHVFTGASQTLVALCDPAEHWTDLLGKTDYDVFPQEYADDYYQLEKQVFAGIAVAHEVQEFRTKDGQKGWVDNRKYPVRDESGEMIGLFGIARVITDRIEAEQEQLRLNRALRLLSECNLALVHIESEPKLLDDICRLLVKTGGYAMAWVGFAENDASKTLRPHAQAGCETGYLEGIELSWDESRPAGQGLTATAIRSGKTQIVQDISTHELMTHCRETAKRSGYRACIAIPLIIEDKARGVLAIYAAEAGAFGKEEVRLLEELAGNLCFGIKTLHTERQREAAESANLAKSAFLANMSHEIRTPLNAITGMTYLMRRSGVAPEQAARLDHIESAGNHLLEIINAILDISKIEAGKFSIDEADVELDTLVDKVAGMVREQARLKNLTILTEVSTPQAKLVGDPTRLQQALLNYAANAVKFTETGYVLLRCRVIDDCAEDALIRFEVEDTGIGIGIPAEALPRLFSPFEQVDNSLTRDYGGTGLGLAITKRLAELMGGSAGADSAHGGGSTFWFSARLKKSVPAITPVSRPALRSAEEILRERYAGRRILLADDDWLNREITLTLLNDAKLVVDCATDGAEALRLAEENSYALILMDMQMPVLDGVTATGRIRQLPVNAGVPIVAITANAFAEDRECCLAAGMNDFIAKPITPGDLFSLILTWLSKPAAT